MKSDILLKRMDIMFELVSDWFNCYNFCGVAHVYLFGSYISQAKFNDIDILIVYSLKDATRIDDILDFRASLRPYLESKLNILIDIQLLNEDENIQTKFTISEDCQFLIKLS